MTTKVIDLMLLKDVDKEYEEVVRVIETLLQPVHARGNV